MSWNPNSGANYTEGPDQEFHPQTFMPSQTTDSIMWRLEGKDVIERIEHRLKGEFLVKKTAERNGQIIEFEEWESVPGARIMNNTGAKVIVNLMEGMLNKISFLSNLEDDTIITKLRTLQQSVAEEILYNWDVYEVHTYPGPVINEVMELIENGLKRARGAGERDSLTKMESISRLVKEGGDSKRFSLFGRNRGEDNAG